MAKYLFASLILSLLSFGIYLYVHLGVSKPVEISQQQRGPITLLWQEHRGAYHQIMPVIQRAEAWALANNVPCSQTFGEFLDDPASMDQDRLRSRAGCVLRTPLKEIPEGFQQSIRPAQQYVVARFEGSPSIGPFTVYPAVRKYLQEQRLNSAQPPLEIYTVNGQKVVTEYLFLISLPAQ